MTELKPSDLPGKFEIVTSQKSTSCDHQAAVTIILGITVVALHPEWLTGTHSGLSSLRVARVA